MGQTIAITVGHWSLLCLPTSRGASTNSPTNSLENFHLVRIISDRSRHSKNKFWCFGCRFGSSPCPLALVLNKNSHDDPIEGCRGEWHPLPDTLAAFLPRAFVPSPARPRHHSKLQRAGWRRGTTRPPPPPRARHTVRSSLALPRAPVRPSPQFSTIANT